jgi:hypothetical protein
MIINILFWIAANWIWFFPAWFGLHTAALWAFFFIVEVWQIKFLQFMLYGKQVDLLMLIGGVIDVSYNLTWGTVIFLWPPNWITAPRQITFSQRLQTYINATVWKDTWRYRLASFICWLMLDRFLPGHCKTK